MICDDIVALKPWFYDDILQSDTNIHHSRTGSLPAQARFLDLLVVESNILRDQRAGMVTLHLYKTEQKFGPPQLCRF